MGGFEMKEKPILFKGEMVRAILEGNKTQTRRIVKGFTPPNCNGNHEGRIEDGFCKWYLDGNLATLPVEWIKVPFGTVGDRLWVRETFSPHPEAPGFGYLYRADRGGDYQGAVQGDFKWKPSIFCTRSASRITLEIVSVRVERLNDISKADAIAEGIEKSASFPTHWKCYSQQKVPNNGGEYVAFNDPRHAYKSLWESINGKGSWVSNPWVWVIEFKKL